MKFNSKRISLLILGVTAIAGSRSLFSLFNDPEGPNLLIVMVTAAIIYAATWVAYAYHPLKKEDGLGKLASLILFQMLLVAGLYICLN